MQIPQRFWGDCVDRKAFVGIGTMIVFIAAILIASIASMVIYRTGNSLQARALTTGDYAQQSISSGVEMMSIRALANTTAQEIYAYEIHLRVLASSDSLNPQSMTMHYRENNGRFEAQWQHPNRVGARTKSFSGVVLEGDFDDDYVGSFALPTVFDLELNDTSSVDDALAVNNNQTIIPTNDTYAFHYLKSSVFKPTGQWNFSPVRNGSNVGVYASFNATNDVTLSLHDNTTDEIYGFITGLNISGTADFVIATDVERCEWNFLKRNTFFCFIELTGNGNDYFDEHEIWKLRYYLSEAHRPSGESTADIQFVTKSGLLSSQKVILPEVWDREYIIVYP